MTRLRPSYASLGFWAGLYLGSLIAVGAFGSWFSSFLAQSVEPEPVAVVDDGLRDVPQDCDGPLYECLNP